LALAVDLLDLLDDDLAEVDLLVSGHQPVLDPPALADLLQFLQGVGVGQEEGEVELVFISRFWRKLEHEVRPALGVNPQRDGLVVLHLPSVEDAQVGVSDRAQAKVLGQESVIVQPQFEVDGDCGVIDESDRLAGRVALDGSRSEVDLVILNPQIGQNGSGFEGNVDILRASHHDSRTGIDTARLE
jgi:hypothetical protein